MDFMESPAQFPPCHSMINHVAYKANCPLGTNIKLLYKYIYAMHIFFPMNVCFLSSVSISVSFRDAK